MRNSFREAFDRALLAAAERPHPRFIFVARVAMRHQAALLWNPADAELAAAKAAEAAAAAAAGGAPPRASVGPAADGGYDKWNRFGDEPFRGFKNGASTRSWRGAAKAEGATTASTAAISSTYKPFHLRNGALPLPSAVAAGGMDCGFRTSKRW